MSQERTHNRKEDNPFREMDLHQKHFLITEQIHMIFSFWSQQTQRSGQRDKSLKRGIVPPISGHLEPMHKSWVVT